MSKTEQIQFANKSLQGVSIGDAFGESFFGDETEMLDLIRQRKIPQTSWEFTDDTVMSLAVFEQLERNGEINQDELALSFVENHKKDEFRGYGATARRILREIEEGAAWEKVSKSAFEGMGSMGNGAAMRSSPIGAYFNNDLNSTKLNAQRSAQITHFNEEAICGSIAIAVATNLATRIGKGELSLIGNDFIEAVIEHLPETDTKSKIKKGMSLSLNSHPDMISTVLGNGTKIMVQDSVPVTIWLSAHYQNNFEEAMWHTVELLGDRDTLCAMVGGITIMSCVEETIPNKWKNAVESFESSVFRNNNNER